MENDLGVILALIRSAILLYIVWMIGKYHDPSATSRPGVSLVAVAIAGTSSAWAFFSVTQIHVCADASRELWPTLFVAIMAVPVALSRGNVAKFFPRVRWSDRP